ncbi:MAG TPA: ferritin-like domain-containing protein [Gemmatimonadaceae bacterium]|nr:ferritin-like domain-containing protein [Gemmatimonadaceae bacterium]
MLGLGGTILVLPSLFSACSDDDSITAPAEPVGLDLTTDAGILNYAFVLEQLEAAFYEAVVASAAFSGMSVEQREVMSDLRNHEVAHRELLRATLGSAAIGDISLNQATVGSAVSSAAKILENAELFEDLGVSAYNGAGKYLRDANTLLLAGKIASVEGRHAAAIRDMREGLNLGGTPANTRFAGDDVVGAQGLDLTREPSVALTSVGATKFVSTGIAIGSQPTLVQSAGDVKAVLDFALTLEILENELYKAVLGTSASSAQNAAFAPVRALMPAATVTAFQQIQKHEAAHVGFLLANGATDALGLGADSFDFTGNRGSGTPGPFARATTELPFLLAMVQGIEDTGVRAYKGQVGALLANRALLESALRIHSVEARHASKLRRLRRASGASGATSVKYSGTVSGGGASAAGTGNITPAPDANVAAVFAAIYAGEDNTTQGGVSITALANLPSVFDATAASEAFDEPLTRAEVLAIVQPFSRPTLV